MNGLSRLSCGLAECRSSNPITDYCNKADDFESCIKGDKERNTDSDIYRERERRREGGRERERERESDQKAGSTLKAS